jgi:hypothetical protein
MNAFCTGLTRSLSFGPSRANWILAKIFATRGIVAKAASIHPLWEQHQQRLIELAEFTPTQLVQLPKDIDEILSHRAPAGADELSCEAIRHGGFSGREDLISTEGRVQVIKVGRLNQVCQAQRVLVLNIRAQQSIQVLECDLSHV